MFLYRIAKHQYINSLSGEGARIYGGRWNKKGSSLLYTASNRSLATVEYLVHLPMALIPIDVYIVELYIPDEVQFEQIEIDKLPKDWANYPAPFSLAKIGTDWINKNESLLLKVPSCIVKDEYNFLINPKHIEFDKIRINNTQPYNFDNRLLKQ